MFTGDRSGDWLYAALHRAGFANQPTSERRDDGLRLSDAYVTAVVRCAPPANNPTPGGARQLPALPGAGAEPARALRTIVALGAFAWDGALRALRGARRRDPAAEAPLRPRGRGAGRRAGRCSAATTRASRTPSPAGSPSRCSTRSSPAPRAVAAVARFGGAWRSGQSRSRSSRSSPGSRALRSLQVRSLSLCIAAYLLQCLLSSAPCIPASPSSSKIPGIQVMLRRPRAVKVPVCVTLRRLRRRSTAKLMSRSDLTEGGNASPTPDRRRRDVLLRAVEVLSCRRGEA